MPRPLLRLLAILLTLAIPLQGMAAVAAGQCMAFGHHQAGGHAADGGHAHDGHDHQDGHGGHAGHDHAGSSKTATHDGEDKSPHCGPCTACCASASIAGPTAFVLPARQAEVAYTFTQSPPPSVPLAGLDRPPLSA